MDNNFYPEAYGWLRATIFGAIRKLQDGSFTAGEVAKYLSDSFEEAERIKEKGLNNYPHPYDTDENIGSVQP